MPELLIGSNGLSLWSSKDLGATLARMSTGAGMYSGSQIWALSAHPRKPDQLYIGTDTGLYVLDRPTGKCRLISSPMDGILVTALAHVDDHPNTLYVGTQPAGIYRTDDGGAQWRKLDAPLKRYVTSGFPGSDMHASDPSGLIIEHWTRVTSILVDPHDSNRIMAGVEIDGAWRSDDGGNSWQEASQGMVTRDIHGFCLVRGQGAKQPILFATTNKGLHFSQDWGASWQLRRIDSPWQYCRAVVCRADDSGVMYLTNGDGPPGSQGRLYRSKNWGSTWELVELPSEIESSVYWVAVHPSDPQLIFVSTNLGQLFRSEDGGDTWNGIKRRLGEVRTLMWLPD